MPGKNARKHKNRGESLLLDVLLNFNGYINYVIIIIITILIIDIYVFL